MTKLSSQRWIAAIAVAVLLIALGAWWSTRSGLPSTIRIATAKPGNLYHTFGETLARLIERRTGCHVELVNTEGSVDNRERLERGEVDLAIMQVTALDFAPSQATELAVFAPLYPEVVHVVVRADSDVESVSDLAGHAISIGPEGSGMRESAKALLAHYRVGLEELDGDRNQLFFEELAAPDSGLDGAIVTTGLDNPALRTLLDSGDWRLLPVLDADAIGLNQPFFVPFEIPRGFFDERPPLPLAPTSTVATTSILAGRLDSSTALVEAALGSLYSEDLRPAFPHLISRRDALESAPVPLHAAAGDFFDPYGGLDVVANFIESLTGIKELLVGLFALGFLLVDQLRRMERRRQMSTLAAQKDYLDEFLTRTIKIERAQMDTQDPDRLLGYLREVTKVKLDALEQLTAEDLRADQAFQIFLVQCAHLSSKIQGRIAIASGVHPTRVV